MDNVYVVVVKEASEQLALQNASDLRFPVELRAEIDPSRKYRVAVWKAVQRSSKDRVIRDRMLGMAAMLGISVASWAGVAVLISHWVR